MSSIYELNKDYAELSAMLEAAETEEEIQAIQDTLEMINVSIEEKLENTGKFIKNTESDITGIKAEIERLTAMKKTKENFPEWQFSSQLKEELVLLLDETLSTMLDGSFVHYDQKLGLIYGKEEKKDGTGV